MRSTSESDIKEMRRLQSERLNDGEAHEAKSQTSDVTYLRRLSAAQDNAQPLDLAVELHSRISVLKGDFPPPVEQSGPLGFKTKFRSLFGIRDLCSIRTQWKQVAIAILLGSTALYCDCIAQVYLQLNTPQDRKEPTLSDRGFDLIPYWKAPHAADYAVMSFVALTFIRFGLFTGPYAMRWTIVRRWFICMGLLFLLRGMSIICTVLPNPDADCKSDVTPEVHKHKNIFVLAFGIAFGIRVTCADVLYSGHTVNFTLAALIWYDYARLCPLWPEKRWGWFEKVPANRMLAIVWTLTGYIIIIATRFHYTVDVWIGFWMTYFVWSYYHEAIKVSPFHNGILMRFLTWQEKHATDLRYWRIRVANQLAYDEELRRIDPREALSQTHNKELETLGGDSTDDFNAGEDSSHP